MNTNNINEAVKDAINGALEVSLHAISFNLSSVLGGLFYSVKLECEKQGGIGDIDNLVRIIVRSSRYDGPEGEEYPVWDEKATEEIIARLKGILAAHGIGGSRFAEDVADKSGTSDLSVSHRQASSKVGSCSFCNNHEKHVRVMQGCSIEVRICDRCLKELMMRTKEVRT